MPAISAPCLGNLTAQTYTDQQVTGTFDILSTASPGSCTVSLIPAGGSQTATYTVTLNPGPPTISGNPGIWWFGGVVPECGDPTLAPCYYTSTVLTVTPGPGGVAPSASAPALWQAVRNGNSVSFSYTDQSHTSVVVTAARATTPDCTDPLNQTQVTVSLGGISSGPFDMVIDTAAGLEVGQDWVGNAIRPLISDIPYTANNETGYTTNIHYLIRSGCGNVMLPMRVNENFTQGGRSQALYNGSTNNWPFVVNNTTDPRWKGAWDVTDFNADNQFEDSLTTADYMPGNVPPGETPYSPTPQPPPPDPTNPGFYSGTSSTWLIWQLQTFRVGSLTQGLGYMVQLGDLTFYLDHARVLPSPPQ